MDAGARGRDEPLGDRLPAPRRGRLRPALFTPVAAVALCGHATLASAHVLWETGRAAGEEIAFATAAGRLTAVPEGRRIALDFPATPASPADAPAGLAAALGVAPVWTGRTDVDWLVEVATPEEVAAARPRMEALAPLAARGVILTAAGGRDGADATSRFFAPAVGIPEDPVTGSAHCALGPFWAERTGRGRLICRQASPRGGVVGVELRGERVRLLGRAVTVLEGRLAEAAAPVPLTR